jgi:hypothetical protein
MMTAGCGPQHADAPCCIELALRCVLYNSVIDSTYRRTLFERQCLQAHNDPAPVERVLLDRFHTTL